MCLHIIIDTQHIKIKSTDFICIQFDIIHHLDSDTFPSFNIKYIHFVSDGETRWTNKLKKKQKFNL